MRRELCNAARLGRLPRTLIAAVGATAIFAGTLTAVGPIGQARAALTIHAPDGRAVTPPGFERDDPYVVPPDDEEARRRQLGEEDVRRYRRVFALQDQGAWDEADREIEALDDRRLLGHVLQRRYLHPDRRASYGELSSWLAAYADHPDADRIHALAVGRQPSGVTPPRNPRAPRMARMHGDLERLAGFRPDPDDLPSVEMEETPLAVAPRGRSAGPRRSDGARVMEHVDALLRAGDPDTAADLLGRDGVGVQLDPAQYDASRSAVAAGLYASGRLADALAHASASAAGSGSSASRSHWIAGLAAFRLKQFDRAARHFEALVASKPKDPWLAAGSNYWAARAHAKKGRQEEARLYLAAAASLPHTFYGLVAERTLGSASRLRWRVPELTGRHLAALAGQPGGLRAIALIQVGQPALAEQELLRVQAGDDALVAESLVALADRGGLPTLALRVGNAVAGPDGTPYDAALYPIPHWEPRDGFSVDRALVFAVMRKESRFDPTAKSPAGAAGLMQIMPGTARHVRNRNDDIDDSSHAALMDPAMNMEMGQRYLAELMDMDGVGSNLVYAAAAYNAGPGNLLRWRKEMKDIDDPLLFMESIPFRETRDYVEKVLANFWIYRLRLGQETSSLDAVAAGDWPVYMPVDARPTEVAQTAGGPDAEN